MKDYGGAGTGLVTSFILAQFEVAESSLNDVQAAVVVVQQDMSSEMPEKITPRRRGKRVRDRSLKLSWSATIWTSLLLVSYEGTIWTVN